jgi:hypothetical protein
LELSDYFDTSRYLTTTSDVVALLVFQHQLAMHNSLTRASHECRRVMDDEQSRQKSLGGPATDEPAYDSARNVIAKAAEDVVDHLLFRNAVVLPDGINGTDAFRRAFAADVRRSSKGHALKDLSLQGRLFANRCSFLIYSDSFRSLPAPLKDRILERLFAALHDDNPQGRYAHLEKDEKHRILDVLRETLPAARRFDQTGRTGH